MFCRLRFDHLRLATLLGVIVLTIVACSGAGEATSPSGTGTQAPSVAPTATVTLPPATPTPVPTPTPSPLPALKALWQGAGPVTDNVATYWPAVDPSTGDIWVAASALNQFWIFKPDGTFVEAWGVGGNGDGQFHLLTNDPNPDSTGAIAFAPDGSFYVADNGNYRIEKFDRNRRFVLKWGSFGAGDGQFGSPKGIATDGTTVWVADDSGTLQAFDANGTFLRSTRFPFVLFSRAQSGHFFVADSSGVQEVDASGTTVHHLDVDWGSLGDEASDVVADGAGHLFAGIQSRSGPQGLVELDASTGAVLGEWSNGAETMAISPNGKTLYLAYTGPGTSYRRGWPFIRAVALP
jgi:sugar lactone lactonase YvrE